MSDRNEIPRRTIKTLFAKSLNSCAFPGCREEIVDAEKELVYGEVCHIEGVAPKAARHNPKLTADQVNAFGNLVLMCHKHHIEIDSNPEKYSVEMLKQFKAEHESRGRCEYLAIDDKLTDLMIRHMEVHIAEMRNYSGNAMHIEPRDHSTVNVTINKVSGRKRSKATVPSEGAIGNDAKKRSYIRYLYNTLVDRKAKTNNCEESLAGIIVAKKFDKKFGATWSNAPVERYEEIVDYLQKEIGKTKAGRWQKSRGNRAYKIYAEFINGMRANTITGPGA